MLAPLNQKEIWIFTSVRADGVSKKKKKEKKKRPHLEQDQCTPIYLDGSLCGIKK